MVVASRAPRHHKRIPPSLRSKGAASFVENADLSNVSLTENATTPLVAESVALYREQVTRHNGGKMIAAVLHLASVDHVSSSAH